MRKAFSCLSLAILVMLVAAALTVPRATAERQQACPPSGETRDRVPPAVLEELLQIRRQRGGILQGTALDAPAAAPAEAAACQDGLAGCRQKCCPTDRHEPTNDRHEPTDRHEREFAGVLERLAVGSGLAMPATHHSAQHCEALYTEWVEAEQQQDQALAIALRSTARWLDDKANDLEETQQYQPADRLRRVAQSMRREARWLQAAGEGTWGPGDVAKPGQGDARRAEKWGDRNRETSGSKR